MTAPKRKIPASPAEAAAKPASGKIAASKTQPAKATGGKSGAKGSAPVKPLPKGALLAMQLKRARLAALAAQAAATPGKAAAKATAKPSGAKPGAVRPDGTPAPEEPGDRPLLDTLGVAVKKMIARGKERGYVTYDEINTALPTDQVSSEQIEDTMSMLSEMGINIVESEEAEESEAARPSAAEAETETESAGGNVNEAELGRTDDPVRMYLREMGSVELLSREGEIAIAKRIEAGREMMIGGICESPMTIKAIIAWHDALLEGKMLLRDIIDLEATQGGGPGAVAVVANEPEALPAAPRIEIGKPFKPVAPPPIAAKTDPAKPAGDGTGDGTGDGVDTDDESDEANLSLAALEAKLTPGVVRNFEKITATYNRLHRMQTQRLKVLNAGGKIKPASEKRYQKLKREMVVLM